MLVAAGMAFVFDSSRRSCTCIQIEKKIVGLVRHLMIMIQIIMACNIRTFAMPTNAILSATFIRTH